LETALLRRLQNVFALLNPEKDAGDFKVIIVFYFKIDPQLFFGEEGTFQTQCVECFCSQQG